MKRRLFFVVCFLSIWVCSLSALPDYLCLSTPSVDKVFNGALKEHIEHEQTARAHILFDTHLSPQQVQERLKIFDREQFSKFLAIARPLIDSLDLFKKASPSPFLTSFKTSACSCFTQRLIACFLNIATSQRAIVVTFPAPLNFSMSLLSAPIN